MTDAPAEIGDAAASAGMTPITASEIMGGASETTTADVSKITGAVGIGPRDARDISGAFATAIDISAPGIGVTQAPPTPVDTFGRHLSPGSGLPEQGGHRASREAPPAPLPGPAPGTPSLGGAVSGGAAFALILLLCLSTYIWAAPPLRRWLRRQPGLRMLSAYVASFESPG